YVEPGPNPSLLDELRQAVCFPGGQDQTGQRVPQLPLFRMPCGCLHDLLNRDDPDLNSTDAAALAGPPNNSDPLTDRVDVVLGADNPFFDFREPGDPGGVGFQRVNTQFLLLGGGPSSIGLNCQAVLPAGLDADGVADGPTVLTPALTWFQELGDGAALQGFIAR